MTAETKPHAPATYQSAWQFNPDSTAVLLSAEDWLDEEAHVDASLEAAAPTPDTDGPNRGGTMRAIAEEIRTLRAERTQWAEQCTKLIAEVERLRATPQEGPWVWVAREDGFLNSRTWLYAHEPTQTAPGQFVGIGFMLPDDLATKIGLAPGACQRFRLVPIPEGETK